jgi:hypothetical protein
MGFLVKYIGGFSSADLFTLHGDTFALDTPFVPVNTTFSDVTIQGAPSFDHDGHLDPGSSRTVQLMLGVATTGTINATGSNVVGTGTHFLTELAVGSFMKINGGSAGITLHRVATITNDTQLTVEDTVFPNVTGGTYVAINLAGSPVTLSGPDAQVTGNLGNVVVPAPVEGPADAVAYFLVTRVGSVDPSDQRIVVKFDAASNQGVYGFTINGQFSYSFTPPVTSDYHNFASIQSLTETDVQMRWTTPGSFSKLVVRLTDIAASATEHVEVFLRINGVDTALGIADATLAQGGDVIHRNDSDSAPVSPDDLVSIRVRITSGGASEEENFGGSAYVLFTPSV